MAYEQPLHLGESREVTREPHAKGDASARGGELQSRAWSFACLRRFARRTKKKIETARSLGKERRALLFLRPSRLRDSLVRSLATCGGEPAGTLPESIQFSRSH